MPPGSVALEIAVAQLDRDQWPQLQELWQRLDQQGIPVETRRRWDDNGLRVAFVPAQIPAELEGMLEPRKVRVEDLEEWQIPYYEQGLIPDARRLLSRQRVQFRPDQPKRVPITGELESASWTIDIDGRKMAGAGHSVSAGFEITSHPHGEGGVWLTLVPELLHGRPLTTVGVVHRSLTLEHGQQEIELRDLQARVQLLPGQTLVATLTPDPTDLGRIFFGNPAESPHADLAPAPRILLIRLVQSQVDDLFQSAH